MPRTKEQQAEYMRTYRERKRREEADRESVYALERGSIPEAKSTVRQEKKDRAEKPYNGPRIEPFPPGSDRVNAPVDIHAACDAKIAELERQLEECRFPPRIEITTMADADKGKRVYETVSRATKPGFLAAPDDDCKTCGHDRHANGHTNGPCQKPTSRKTKCLCNDYDLGFE